MESNAHEEIWIEFSSQTVELINRQARFQRPGGLTERHPDDDASILTSS